jgi:flagella basal body P-ring formation protein FlgA
MKRLLAPVCLACLAFAPAPVAGAQVVVRGQWVTLGDVAPVTGDAAATLLGPAPAPGQTMTLDPRFVVEAARRADILLAIPLDQPILVSRAGTAAPQAPTAPVARVAPAAPVAPSADGPGDLAGPPKPGWILVLVRDVARGARIAEGDVEWSEPPANGVRARGGPDDMNAVIGQEASRLLRAGQPLQVNDFKPPTVIHKGDPVRLIYVSEGLRLTVDGQAQTDAAAGEAVRVLNRFSKRSIDAIATVDGEARVSR